MTNQERLAKQLMKCTAEEAYETLGMVMLSYASQFTDSRLAVIEWLKCEKDGVKPVLKEPDRPHGEWIPLKYRPMDEDEYRAFREEYGDLPVEERKIFACPMPEDGQEILISTKFGNVFYDTCVYDGETYELEEYCDWLDVLAWMPLPEPYRKEGDEK